MKNLLRKSIIILLLFSNYSIITLSNDSINYVVVFAFYGDLSDTYGGGGLFSSEFTFHKSWYGASISYGHFHSKYTFLFKVPYEELEKTLEIPIHEMVNMKNSSLSFLLTPIKKKWISIDLSLGIALAKANCFYLKNIDYSYNLAEDRFTYLYRDYQLVKRTHFGYQAGFNISFFPVQKFGIQLNSRIQHLNNGGSFFFVGSGIIFRL
ncbi:MAG TPA: hypothetical protein DDW27_14195 [Bacteroidales bacterium]|jgi:hypothetical protein|nr:hypothetical protein [Bacteroidales bacterium]